MFEQVTNHTCMKIGINLLILGTLHGIWPGITIGWWLVIAGVLFIWDGLV